MRSIKQYIYEVYNKIHLQEVIVKFSVEDTNIVIEVPDSFMEDQINTYLDDTVINKTFVSNDYVNDLFGKNTQYLSDVYFEYTGLNKTSLKPNIKWDNSNVDYNIDDTQLKNIKLDNFKFVITFNGFDIYNGESNENEIQNVLLLIFERCISGEFDWPLNFTLKQEDIEFKK